MKQRELVLYILLTVFTCGIFGFVWIAFMANDLNRLTNDQSKFGGGMVVFLSIITCGIFLLYWYYDAGKSIEKAKFMRNMPSDQSMCVIYLILGLFGGVYYFGIVAMALIQNEINKMVYIAPVNNGVGYDCNYATNSQPYNNQSYYNSEQTYSNSGNTDSTGGYYNPNQNNYSNSEQSNNYNSYNQNNYNNSQQGYNQNNYNNDWGYNQNNNPDNTNN